MSDDDWIIVRNWERFQHYKDRQPAWIKAYTELVHSDEYLRLTAMARALLHGVWALYALHRHVLDTRTARRSLGLDARAKHWEELVQAGFIELSASKPLARRYQRASPEVEVLRTSTKESASRKAARKGGRLSSAEQEPLPPVELSDEQLAAIRAENIARAAALRDRFH